MKKFKIGITIEARDAEQVKKVGGLLQSTLNKVEQEDIVKLLSKVVQNPKIVKTALKFV